MSVAIHASGTQSATIGTEHQLDDVNVVGEFGLNVDTVNMVAGDVLELRIYKMILTGGTARPIAVYTYSGAQNADELIKCLPMIANGLTDSTALRFSLKQTQGTGRSFKWEVINKQKFPINFASQVIDANGLVDANAVKVGPSGSGVPQTGGDIFPAVSNIAATSAALNTTAGSRSITTGTETGTLSNSNTADGVYHNITDSGGTIDFYYQFDISGTNGALGVGINWLGYVIGIVNTIKVYAYNWAGASWDQIGTIVGIAGVVNAEEDWQLTSAHTGTGANAGLVRIRFNATGLTTATIKTDRILLGYAIVQDITTIPAAILDLANGVETGKTVRQVLRLLAAAEGGKLSGAATTQVKIRDLGDSKDRVTATVDSDGNRTAITLDLT